MGWKGTAEAGATSQPPVVAIVSVQPVDVSGPIPAAAEES